MKNLNLAVEDRSLEELIYQLTGVRNRVHRYRYRDTGKPLPVVKVTFNNQRGIDSLLAKKLIIQGVEAQPEEFKYRHSREIRC